MIQPTVVAKAHVKLWSLPVGTVTEYDNGRIGFEYDATFIKGPLNISPSNLPLRSGVFEFPGLRSDAFQGLPGVISDSLPDTFGNLIIQNYFNSKGKPDMAMSPVQRLLYIGNRAMGALEFSPGIDRELSRPEVDALEIKQLVDAARKLVEGHTTSPVAELLQIGASAGGARAKALILWNKESNRIRSGFAPMEPGEESYLIKFDGVSSANAADHLAKPFNRIEYVYSLLAADAGIAMAPISYIESPDGHFHFMAKRFDRSGAGEKVHMHSLGGMEHVDFNMPGTYSYEAYFRLVTKMNLGQQSLDQAFRRAVFNIVGRNQDDHVKNLSFLMAPDGKWSLSPAYDLTYANGAGYTAQHQMRFADKFNNFTAEDIIKVGEQFDIKSPKLILENIVHVFSGFAELATEYGVDDARILDITSKLRLLAPVTVKKMKSF